MLSVVVESATREFAARLRASQPIAANREATAHLVADLEAQRLLAKLQRQQQALVTKQQTGQQVTEGEIAGLRAVQLEVKKSPVIMSYIRSQQEAQSFLSRVNMEISELLGFDFGGLAGAGGG
mgnify:CR=1 FL=1